jgi:hypothetical protein
MRGLIVRLLSSVLLLISIRRSAYIRVIKGNVTDGGDGMRLTVPMSLVDSDAAVPALLGLTVAKIHGSSSSPFAIVITVSLLYISVFEKRSPRLASHSSRRSMRIFNASVCPADRINRCRNNSRAYMSWLAIGLPVGLSLGFFTRHFATKSLKSREYAPSRIGGSCFGIKRRTRIGWYSDNGGSPLASSMAVIPSDQISALKSYPD